MKKIFLIDSMAYIFRSFYAIRRMNSKDGTPTNALFGFVNSVEKIIRDFNPEYIVCVFDAGSKTFRNDIYPEYKANRSECPEDLKPQFDLIKQYVSYRNIPMLIQEGFEADDIIGSVCTLASKQGFESIICSGDKDMMQLVNDKVSICHTHKNNYMINRNEVKQILDIYPEQVIDYLTLTGDSSDNIPGLPGIGAKTAAQLLNQFGTFENIIDNRSLLKGKRQIDAFNNHLDKGYLSQKLVTIVCDMDLKVSLEDLTLSSLDYDKLFNFYQGLNLNKLSSSLENINKRSSSSLSDKIAKANAISFKCNIVNKKSFDQQILQAFLILDEEVINLFNYYSCSSHEELLEQLKNLNINSSFTFLSQAKSFVFSSELLQEQKFLNYEFLLCFYLYNYEQYKLYLASLSLEESSFVDLLQQSSSYDLDFVTEELSLAEFKQKIASVKDDTITFQVIAEKKSILEAEISGMIFKLGSCDKCNFIAFNSAEEVQLLADFFKCDVQFISFDMKEQLHILASNNIDIVNLSFDVSLAAYIACSASISFEELALKYLNYQVKYTKEDKILYYGEFLVIVAKVYELVQEELLYKNLYELYNTIEIPLIKSIFQMERKGILVDKQSLLNLKDEYEQKINSLKEEIFTLSEEEFNLNSPKQVASILFDKLKLNSSKKNKTTQSTDSSVLQELKNDHPIIEKIIDYRMYYKLLTSYLETLPSSINLISSRIHATFSQTTTATGRLSSLNPNLQNIPIRNITGKKIRNTFKAKENHSLIACDYSQIELRILAHLSCDESLIHAFNEELDIHSFTASEVFNKDIVDVSSEERYKAKAVNFGVIYGQGAQALAKQINVSTKEAQEFIKQYFNRYSSIQQYMQICIEKGKELGYVETLFHRRRYLDELFNANIAIMRHGERLAINSPIQGSAADLIKIAMINIDKKLNEEMGSLLLQIHDELIFEIDNRFLAEAQELIKQEMINAASLKVPLKVHTKISEYWQ